MRIIFWGDEFSCLPVLLTGDKMDFYRINEHYIDFLQGYERRCRGFTKVPNVKYQHRNKFSFGAVLSVNGLKYYVSVSSFTKKQEANILIKVSGDKEEIKGSLRFNYMIPVPDNCLKRLNIKEIEDEKYRTLLNKEYQFCIHNEDKIQKKANQIYLKVIQNRSQFLTDNSCDFKLLEKAYHEYINKSSI